jgi:D-alanyl-D-alanine carboxypeptidase (penicillin-binding protein 5/6)
MTSSTPRRLTASVASAVLAAVLPLMAGGAAASAEPTPAASASVAAASESPIPCPKAVAPAVSRPPRPSPPAANPAQQAVGGGQLASPGLVVPAGVPSPPATTAISWLVADLDTGEVLGACGAHEYGTPASVQKLLLTATFSDKLDPHQVVTVTAGDLKIPSDSSMVGLVEGGHYTVETLWLGLLLQSGNDAANVLARLGGGNVAGGVQAMNAEAARLGAYQTHAVTPSGYDGPGQFTSAYDLALIARVCFANETFRRYAVTQRTQIPAQPPRDKGFQIQNENQLIFKYPGALGGKTGFTSLARHTYVGAAERHGRRLAVTLLGAEPRPLRAWQQGARLLDWGFSLPQGVSVGHLVTPDEVAAPPMTSVPASGHVVAAATADGGAWSPIPVAAGMAVAIGVSVLIGLLQVYRRRRRA